MSVFRGKQSVAQYTSVTHLEPEVARRYGRAQGGVGQGALFGIGAPEEACPKGLSQDASPVTR